MRMLPVVSSGTLQDEVHRALITYWNACRGMRTIPSRADIDPVDIGRLLPHVGLIDVADDPRRYRYRLIGTDMVEYFGVDFTGCWLHEVKQGSYKDYLQDLYSQATELRIPVFSVGQFEFGALPRRENVRRLVLPLGPDDGPVTMLLFSNLFDRPVVHAQDLSGPRAAAISTFLENERATVCPAS